MRFIALGWTIEGAVTLEGEFFLFEVAKSTRTGAARILSGTVGACNGGSVVFLRASFPWEVAYESFNGTLPEIRAINFTIVDASIQGTVSGISCLARSSTTNPLRASLSLVLEAGQLKPNSLTMEPVESIPLTGTFCTGSSGRVEGTSSIYEPNTEQISRMLIILRTLI